MVWNISYKVSTYLFFPLGEKELKGISEIYHFFNMYNSSQESDLCHIESYWSEYEPVLDIIVNDFHTLEKSTDFIKNLHTSPPSHIPASFHQEVAIAFHFANKIAWWRGGEATAAYFKLIILGWKFPQMCCVAQLLMMLATHTGQTAIFKIVILGNIDTKVRVGMLLIQTSRTHNN